MTSLSTCYFMKSKLLRCISQWRQLLRLSKATCIIICSLIILEGALFEIESSVHFLVLCRVKVCRVDNLGLRQSKVYVEVSLHFGCHPMGSVHRTPIKSLVSLSAIWNEELEFDIAIRDIPRVSEAEKCLSRSSLISTAFCVSVCRKPSFLCC